MKQAHLGDRRPRVGLLAGHPLRELVPAPAAARRTGSRVARAGRVRRTTVVRRAVAAVRASGVVRRRRAAVVRAARRRAVGRDVRVGVVVVRRGPRSAGGRGTAGGRGRSGGLLFGLLPERVSDRHAGIFPAADPAVTLLEQVQRFPGIGGDLRCLTSTVKARRPSRRDLGPRSTAVLFPRGGRPLAFHSPLRQSFVYRFSLRRAPL